MRKTFFKCLVTLIIFIISMGLPSYSQTDTDRIKRIKDAIPVLDELYRNFSVQYHSPGLVYGLVADGKLIHTASYGYSNLAEKNKVTDKTRFRIASMTKSFTAMAILRLRDENRLKLDDPVYLYIPEMKGQKYLTEDAPDITIRHLLTHSAGFPEDNPWGDRQLEISEEKFIDMIKKGISFSTNPGSGYEYSNMGFAMLGYIISKVSGLPYADYITQQILTPLGMTNTFFEYDRIPAAELALGYKFVNGKYVVQPMLHDGIYGAMGGMITSAEKSNIFAENFFIDNSIGNLKREAEELFLKAGKIKNIGEMNPQNNLRGSFIIECEKANIEISFTLTPENPPLIQEYHIREI